MPKSAVSTVDPSSTTTSTSANSTTANDQHRPRHQRGQPARGARPPGGVRRTRRPAPPRRPARPARPGARARSPDRSAATTSGGGPQQHRVVRREAAGHVVGAAQRRAVPQHQHRRRRPRAPRAAAPRSRARTRPAPVPIRDWASRLVRLETGSSSEAELASQIEANANGSALMPELGGQRQPDRGEQHGRGVDAEHPRRTPWPARVNSRNSTQPAAARDPGGHVRADVEQPRVVAQVGHHLDQHQEQQDRPDPFRDARGARGGARWLTAGGG